MEIEAERVARAFKKFKTSLNERERDVIMRYYGIDTSVRHTLKEIGAIYQVTRERIRQIKVVALQKLKVTKK